MKVELLWFSGCPSWQETEARLREALSLAAVDAVVHLVEVTTPEDARRLRFRGSPTVLLDGTDPFADPSDPVGLACRVYRTPDGLRGSPTVEQLATSLRAVALGRGSAPTTASDAEAASPQMTRRADRAAANDRRPPTAGPSSAERHYGEGGPSARS